MSFIFSKLLSVLLKPLIWILVLLGFSLFAKNGRKKKLALISAFSLLLFFSNTWIFNHFAKLADAPYPVLRHYDVGILLGGFSGVNAENKIVFTSASDRILQTISLYKRGVIGKIMVSSGSANLFDDTIKEADLAANYLRDVGIPDSAIVVENQSRNTNENLKYSYQIMEDQNLGFSVLVITSAWHIPRTKLISLRQDLFKPDFYPTHQLASSDLTWEDYIIPNVSTMNNWGILIKEWVGTLALKVGIIH